jgi:mannose-6-phosphate isomerase class I
MAVRSDDAAQQSGILAFVGKESEIITGQAYFEISHNPSMSFVVKKGDTEVEVLGTHFNISAFESEDMNVTLLEGSVKVSNNGQAVTIKPGEQARLTSNMKPQTIVNVDFEEVMAWKNGNFQFEGADIHAVMKQLERWYDIEVVIKGNIKEHFGGTISRAVNVSQVFNMLKLTGEVNYKIEGRKIIEHHSSYVNPEKKPDLV